MQYSLLYRDLSTKARAGCLITERGVVRTPVFMPVGTVGAVKAVEHRELECDIGAEIILGNTYHLFLRPGPEVIERAGGLHAFMSWKHPILTDSGGFQVYSLAKRCRVTDDAVTFRSHLDGSAHVFSPESVIDIQRRLGSDIMMVLDECPAGDVSESYARVANKRTIRWAARCKRRFAETRSAYGQAQTLFAIVQGVVYPSVRRDSALHLVDLDFPGYAIGGLSVGESAEEMYAMVELVCDLLPEHKPRYLMGVGTPENILESIARGVDMFDCVLPTRNARNGRIYTTEGELNIRNAKWKEDFSPLDPGLDGYVSQTFSKAYVRHLFLAGEILGMQIAALQNLSLYTWLARGTRAAIVEGCFSAFRAEAQPRLGKRL